MTLEYEVVWSGGPGLSSYLGNSQLAYVQHEQLIKGVDTSKVPNPHPAKIKPRNSGTTFATP